MPPIVAAAAIGAAASVGTGVAGAKAQSAAAKRAAETQRRSEDTSLAYQRERDAQERADKERYDQELAKRYDAEQEFARKKWEAEEDDRLYQRKIYEEDRAWKVAERERRYEPGPPPPPPDPRLAQKRAMQEQAMRNLGQMLGLGQGTAAPGAQAQSAFAMPATGVGSAWQGVTVPGAPGAMPAGVAAAVSPYAIAGPALPHVPTIGELLQLQKRVP